MEPPVEEKQAEVEVTLRRDLGLLEVLMIGIGPNIGSTIFILIGTGTEIAGPGIILAFILNFFVTICTAVSYAELSSAFPETGGGYLWVKEGMFPPFGFLGGWMSWVGHCIACSVYALGFGSGVVWFFQAYNVEFFGLEEWPIRVIFSVAIALVFIYMNYRGVKGAGRSEIIVSLILLAVITTFILFAFYSMLTKPGPNDNFDDFIPNGTMSILTSMAFTFMVFEGYEVVAQTGEEAKDPHRTVPKAMFLCIGISTFLFVAVAIAAIGVSGWHDIAGWKDFAIINSSEETVPWVGGGMVAFGIIIGSVAAVNSIVFSVSRVSFAMGRDGNLPSRFAKLHPKNQTPTTALMVSGAIIIVMCFLPMDQVAAVADILILLLFTLVNISSISLRKKRPDVVRYFIMPLFPLLPLIGITMKLILAYTLFDYEPLAWYIAIAVINVGLLIHYFAKGRKEIEAVPIPERAPMSKEELGHFRVLIPIDDPHSEALVDLGCLMAAEHNGDIMLVSVVEIPSSLPISDVDRKMVEDRKKMIEKLKVQAEMNGIRTRALVTVSHDVVTALIDTAKEEDANTILLGWKGYTKTQKRILGKKMDLLLRLTPCDVVLFKIEEKFRPDRILILSGGLWHVSRATELAALIAKRYGSRVTILNIIAEEKYCDIARSYSKRLTEILEKQGVQVVVNDVRPETVIGGVIAESIDYDLLVMGSSAVKRVHRTDFGLVQDHIVKSAQCPVLIYKRVATFEEKEEEEAELVDIRD